MDRLTKNEMMVILDQQLQNAQNIQKKIIPRPQSFESADYRFFAYLKPFRRVGGDFYDFHTFENNQVSLILADTTGHGLDAAMITSMVKLIYSYGMKDPLRKESPSELLHQLDSDIESQLSSSFFSAITLKLDPKNECLYYANAGHPAGIVVHHDGELSLLNPTLPLIGMHQIMSEIEYKDQCLPFEYGDKLIIFTDGLPDATNLEGENFGLKRIEHIIRTNRMQNIKTLCQELLRSFTEFTKSTRVADDICLLGLEYDPIENQA